jgi:opacity protein-like surface antigen
MPVCEKDTTMTKHAFSHAPVVMAMAFAAALLAPQAASAQGAASIGGFGGVTLSGLSAPPASLGGGVTFDLAPGVQVTGEVGRIGSVLPPLSSDLFSLTGLDIRASAFYGEAGVRLLAAPSAHVTPYGEASVGFSRLSVSSPQLGAAGNAATSIALGLAGRNAPLAGLGGGVLLRTGPVVVDLGYRYKQLFPNDVLRVALGFGQPLRTHQVRAGIGVRF